MLQSTNDAIRKAIVGLQSYISEEGWQSRDNVIAILESALRDDPVEVDKSPSTCGLCGLHGTFIPAKTKGPVTP